MSSLATILSRHTADASTPEPTYGTSSSSSRPWTVPSSPNGPCSTANTTSAPSSPRPARSCTSSPSCSQVPSTLQRQLDDVVARGAQPGGHRRAAGDRDLVLGRTPAGQHDDPHGGDGVVVVRRRRRRRRGRIGIEIGVERADRDRHRRAAVELGARLRILRLHHAVLVGRVDRHVLGHDLEPAPGQCLGGLVLRVADDVGHRDLVRLGRHGDRDRAAVPDLGAGPRVLAEDRARVGLRVLLLDRRDREARRLQRAARRVLGLAGDVGNGDLLAARSRRRASPSGRARPARRPTASARRRARP